jgi:hypothetical protein
MRHRNEAIKQDGKIVPGHEFPVCQVKQFRYLQDVNCTALSLREKSGDLCGLADIVSGDRHI